MAPRNLSLTTRPPLLCVTNTVAVAPKLGVEPGLPVIGRLWDRGPLPEPGRVGERNNVEVKSGGRQFPKTPWTNTTSASELAGGAVALWTSPYRLERVQKSVLMSA
jgi:hypothetical protein